MVEVGWLAFLLASLMMPLTSALRALLSDGIQKVRRTQAIRFQQVALPNPRANRFAVAPWERLAIEPILHAVLELGKSNREPIGGNGRENLGMGWVEVREVRSMAKGSQTLDSWCSTRFYQRNLSHQDF